MFRFIYVRNAHGLLRDKARLLHILVWIFISIWFSKRALTYHLLQLVRGLNYEKTTKGMLCMMKNMTMTQSRNMEESYVQYLTKTTVMVFVSTGIFNIVLTVCCLLSLSTRWNLPKNLVNITFKDLFQEKIFYKEKASKSYGH